jgi:hypothetical protein
MGGRSCFRTQRPNSAIQGVADGQTSARMPHGFSASTFVIACVAVATGAATGRGPRVGAEYNLVAWQGEVKHVFGPHK